jgi:iron complex outermembrane recepter protein
MKQAIFLLLFSISIQTFSQDTTIIKTIQLENVLVTSVRADKKTPVTQKTIGDTSLMETYQGQELPMLIGTLPSIYSNSDGGHAQGYTYFTLRGATQNRINMTLNGVPLNEPEDHGFYSSNYPSFINAIKSIQIQRGVGTSSNGTASFIGSMNFQSKNGFKRGSELQIGAGSYNTGRFNFSTSTGLTPKNLALFVNVGGLTTDGFRDNSATRGGSVFISGGYYGEKNVTKVSFFSGVSKNQMAWEGSTDSALNINFRDNPRGNDRRDYFNQTHIQLQNIFSFDKLNKLTSTVFFNYLDGYYDVYNEQSLSTNGYYANENQTSNWIGYIGQYDRKSKSLDLTLGVSANTYTRKHNGFEQFVLGDTKYVYVNEGNKNDVSGFIKANFKTDGVYEFFDLQVRYVDFNYSDVFNTTFEKQKWLFVNPKFGIKTFINKNSDVYFSVGMSHREPTRSIMFQNSFTLYGDSDPFTEGIKDHVKGIKPESVTDLEIGTNIKSERLTLQSNLFLMLFQNEFIPVGYGLNSLPIMVNLDNSYRMGFELDMDYKINSEFTYNMNTTLSQNRFDNGSKVQTFSPSVILNHGISFLYNGFGMNVNHSYYSMCYIDVENINSVPDYSVFGMNLSYEYKNYKLSLQGNNLTSAKYYCNGYSGFDDKGKVIAGSRYLFPNALTNFYATLRVWF